MKTIQWIVSHQSHHAVIASTGGYINLTATRNVYSVELIRNGSEETVVYSNAAKNLSHAKMQSVAYGYALLKDAGLHRSKRKSISRKRLTSSRLTSSMRGVSATR